MQTKISSQPNFTGITLHQEQITSELIKSLRNLLLSKAYLTYLKPRKVLDFTHELNIEGQLNFHFGRSINKNETQNIRTAILSWNQMGLIYRLTVLDAFSTLYHEAMSEYSSDERTVLFCRIFLTDFVDIITSN